MPTTAETYNFFVTCDFLLFRAHPLIWMCCIEKVGWLFCCMKDRKCSKLFYWVIFYPAMCVHSFNFMTITERLNSCATKIVQCAPTLIHVKLYDLIMRNYSSKCTVWKKSVNLCWFSRGLIFANFSFFNADILHFQPGSTVRMWDACVNICA